MLGVSVRLCNIVPISLLKAILANAESHHLVLADLVVENAKYLHYYTRRRDNGDFIILDSMAFENNQSSTISVMTEAVRLLRPNEIVLTDIVDDPRGSMQLTKLCAHQLLSSGVIDVADTSFMAVPHGKTVEEFVNNARELSQIQNVKTIGVQEEIEDLYGISRLQMVRMVKRMVPCYIHLNGVTEELEDLRSRQMRRLVRTGDTSKLVVWGLNGITVDPESTTVPAYPGRRTVGGRVGYFYHKTTSSEEILTARQNIAMWREELSKDARDALHSGEPRGLTAHVAEGG
jgi:hypothetical protein